MIILGLTGSIGMGKSTVARMFADEGVPVFDADAVVHRLQGPDGALVAEIEAPFRARPAPEGVDRTALAERVLAEPAALRRLEALVHPAVAREREAFLAAHAAAPVVVLDIPLLFEKGGGEPGRQGRRGLRRPRGAAPAHPRAAGHDAGEVPAHPLPPAARRRKARPRRFRHPDRLFARRNKGFGSPHPRLPRGDAAIHRGAMREIVFDTETTGLSPRTATGWSRSAASRWSTGSRPAAPSTPISTPAGRCRARPRRCTASPTASSPTSRPSHDVCEELLEFIGDSPLVAHNAELRFRLHQPRARRLRPAARRACRGWSDTLALARQKFPGAKHSLDALCTRFGVDRSQRIKHGALLDAQLLAQVYVELTGGRQIGLTLVAELVEASARGRSPAPRDAAVAVAVRPPRPHAPSRGGAGAPRRLPRRDRGPDLESALARRSRLTMAAGRAHMRARSAHWRR